jgi:PilZ domain-containing protein
MSKRGRSSDVRERENSKLIIKGVDSNGKAFSEHTETFDISETGVSFFLQNPIWVDTHLTVEITSSELFDSPQTVGAKVVRVRVDPSGRHFVAVRFD